MAWNAQDMNPNLKLSDLMKTGAMGKEKIITQYILPAMRTACPLMPKKMASETTMRGFAERALEQNFTPESIIAATKCLPDRYEAWPSWLEFHATLRSFQPARNLTDTSAQSTWFADLRKATDELIEAHGREKIEQLAEVYSQGVYGWSLGQWGAHHFSDNVIRLFVHDRMRCGTHSSMGQVIAYAKARLNPNEKNSPKIASYIEKSNPEKDPFLP